MTFFLPSCPWHVNLTLDAFDLFLLTNLPLFLLCYLENAAVEVWVLWEILGGENWFSEFQNLLWWQVRVLWKIKSSALLSIGTLLLTQPRFPSYLYYSSVIVMLLVVFTLLSWNCCACNLIYEKCTKAICFYSFSLLIETSQIFFGKIILCMIEDEPWRKW